MFSPEFDAIQAARCFDDPSLAQGEWIIDVKEADWPGVIRLCEDILARRSKDLRVAIWLTEALARTRRLAGLAEGFTFLARFCRDLWPDLHPLPDEGDQEARIGNLDWLVAQSVKLVRDAPLTASSLGSYTTCDLESARATAQNMDRHPAQAEELARQARVTLARFEAARKDTPGEWFVAAMADAEGARAAVAEFKLVVDGLLGHDAPALGALFEALDGVHDACRRYAQEAGVLAPAAVAADAGGQAAPPPGPAAPPPLPEGPIQSREQAVRQLREIAAFFKHSEPHSPVAYLVDKAAVWAGMPLHEWLRAVLKDDATLSRVEELLGVQPGQGDAPR